MPMAHSACQEGKELSARGTPADAKGKAQDDGTATKKKKKKKWSDEIRVDLSCCKYEILRIVIQKLGWQEAADEKLWHLLWTDTSINPERLMSMRRGQKVNHFLGMLQICRKKSLARHLANMGRMFPTEYKFFPRAFILPNHIQDLIMRLNSDRIRTYILKPDNGCQGRGVVLVQSVADLKQAIGGMAGSNMLAQKYLTNPMLLNGYKFDLRIYALILSCDPLRLFLYREGIARFCTEKYMKPDKGNLKQSCMHLTNYAVNKNNTNFEFNSTLMETDKGSKWTLTSLFKALAAKGYDIGRLKRQIRKMVVLTIISIVPLLVHNYRNCVNEDDNGRSCFELLGIDILLDDKCRPWLLEVNHSPSFAIDTPLDFKVKESLLNDTLRLLNIDPLGISRYKLQDKKGSKMRLYGRHQNSKDEVENLSPKINNNPEGHNRTLEYDEFECRNLGNFDRIYPPDDMNLQSLYNILLAGSEELFKQSFDMKVKSAILKAQEARKREELEKEAAERKRLRKLREVRKKAQESAKLAASTQQTNTTIVNQSECSEDTLSDIGKRIILDMASPHSSVETPTGWERARSMLERVSERGRLGLQGEEKMRDPLSMPAGLKSHLQHSSPVDSKVLDPLSMLAGSKNNMQQSSPVDFRRRCMDNCTTSSPKPSIMQPLNSVPQPYNSNIAIPRLSSLPCITPQSFYRHHLRKLCYSRASLHHQAPELDAENLLVRRHYMTRSSLELKKENLLLERRSSSFFSTRPYQGRLPELQRSIFPHHSMDLGSFLGEPRHIMDVGAPFRSPIVTATGPNPITKGLKTKYVHNGMAGRS